MWVTVDVKKWMLSVLAVLAVAELGCVSANVVSFEVRHKFAGRDRNLSSMMAHDVRRRGRLLSAVDLEMGGNGNPSDAGLYFAKIGLGTPPKDYYVQVDTGSDILWVNSIECDNCPKKNDIGVELTLYDPRSSSTSSYVYCDQDFCTSTYDGLLPGCKPNLQCQYNVAYGDGSSTSGYFVKDTIQFNRVTGNLQTTVTSGSVIFGCGTKQSGDLGSSTEAVDGIIGFGESNTSIISQLAAAGKIKRIFAHCLDNINGGGIFTIGEIVSPKVNTTPMVPNQQHYNVATKKIEVGGDVLDLPTYVFGTGDKKGTIIDSGTTLALIPKVIYDPLMAKILNKGPKLKLQMVEEFSCFQFNGNVDDGFPLVKFYFEGSVSLTVYPHDYLFAIKESMWCFGWVNGGPQSEDSKNIMLLGDMVLSNKLVVYDIENQTIGWTEYNCSSSIKVKDEMSGAVYTVGAHILSSAPGLTVGVALTLLSILTAFIAQFYSLN
ncbi:hypothetical protein SLA2020_473550 [Shorea laevis]